MVDSRKVTGPFAAAVLIAAIVMIGATFAPFATQGCIFCPIGKIGAPYAIPSVSPFHSLDGWIVLCVAIALALAAAALVMRVQRSAVAIATLVLSAAALALVIKGSMWVAALSVGMRLRNPWSWALMVRCRTSR